MLTRAARRFGGLRRVLYHRLGTTPSSLRLLSGDQGLLLVDRERKNLHVSKSPVSTTQTFSCSVKLAMPTMLEYESVATQEETEAKIDKPGLIYQSGR